MRCREARMLIPSYLAPNEPWLKPKRRVALEVHLAHCDACWQEYEESHHTVELLQRHCQISEDTQTLLDKADRQNQEPNVLKVIANGSMPMKIAAIAAAIVICLVVGPALLTNQDPQEPGYAVHLELQDQRDDWEIRLTEKGVLVPSAGLLTTDDTNLREFLIDDRHRLVMNTDTTLSLERLTEDERPGYLVSLRSGQILAHVAHDGNPFEVRSPHGKAVITGTIFDVNVSDQEMHLVVSEGSVRFGSDARTVQVTAGTWSMVAEQGMPSSPVSCQANQLMAWAFEPKPPSSERDPSHELSAFVDELAASMPSPWAPIDLESLDYEHWIEAERDWFRAQFPWIFELQEAIRAKDETLRREVSVPSYPELLLQSGDLWQTVYPERIYRIIPIVDAKSLSELAIQNGLGDTWPTRGTGWVNGRHSRQQGMVFGLASLEKWLLECRKIQSLCESGRETGDVFEYSQAMAEYLEHTRALAWLCVQKGQLLVPAIHREKMLNLLRGQVAAAHVVRTVWREIQYLDGHDSRLGTYQREIVEGIVAIIECERKIRGMLGASVINN